MASKFQVMSLGQSDLRVKDYKRRKPHKKTRLGCQPCKTKRVKCDQARPICLRCERNCRACSYPGDEYDLPAVGPSQDESKALSLTISRILNPSPADLQGPEYGTPRAALIHHFSCSWEDIFDIPRLPISVNPVASNHACLQSTMLAISASHLRHLTNDPRAHRVAENFQQSLALSDFQQKLSQPLSELGPRGIDALLLTSMLLNMLNFALPSDEDAEPANSEIADPSKSWVFSTRTDRLGWLAVQMGLKSLLTATRPYRANTIMGPIFDASDEYERKLLAEEQSMDAVPDSWFAVFGLRRESREEDGEMKVFEREETLRNHYLFRELLRLLAEITTVEPTRWNIYRYIQLVGKLEPEFRGLLYDRDEKALWIFGYWMGLMCRFEGLWWCDRRVRRDYLAIRLWFQYLAPTERPGKEGMLWVELMRDYDLAWEWPVKEAIKSRLGVAREGDCKISPGGSNDGCRRNEVDVKR